MLKAVVALIRHLAAHYYTVGRSVRFQNLESKRRPCVELH